MDTDTPFPYRPSTSFDLPKINFWGGFPAQISTDVYKNHVNKRQERAERALIEAAQVERERVERERVERERVERERFDAILSQKGKNPEAKPFTPRQPPITRVLKHFNF